MNAVDDSVEVLHCKNHPGRETYLRCGKCGEPICTKCTVPTSVGSRCPQCAQIRRLPQYDVGLRLLVPAAVAGLAVSATGWYVLNYIPVFRFFAAAFLGIAVGTVVSRVARRRVSPFLTGAAVASIVLGWVVAEAVWYGGSVSWISHGSGSSGVWIALPLLLACYLTYTRVR